MRAAFVGIFVLCLAGGSVFLLGQAGGPSAPTTEAKRWSEAELSKEVARLAATKETNFSFFREPAFNSEIRRLVGKQPVLQHGKRADFMVIRDGEGTFVWGGKLIGSTKGVVPDDLSGTAIEGGTTQVLRQGDVMYIPPGLPHHFVEIKDHVTFIMARWDVK